MKMSPFEQYLLSLLDRAGDDIGALLAENARLRARLAALQDPEGHREEGVVKWLRERGYTVVKLLTTGTSR